MQRNKYYENDTIEVYRYKKMVVFIILDRVEEVNEYFWNGVTQTPLHELSAPDHYCELDKNGNCEHAQYCENLNHTHDNKAPRWNGCVMDNSSETEDVNSAFVKIALWRSLSQRDLSKIYCGKCYVNILVYLWGNE